MTRPSFDDLRLWLKEGGCVAACEEDCWVELDGHCPHGKESWFLKLGLI